MRPALALLALAACTTKSEPPPAPTPIAATAIEVPPEVQLRLTVERATLRALATQLSRESGQPVVIGSAVEPVADCLRVTILNPEPAPASAIVEQVRAAVRDSGVTLEVEASELRFVAAEGAQPSCPRPALSTPTRSRTAVPEGFIEGITEVSDSEWTITRSAAETITRDHTIAAARIIPHEQDGEVIGMKLYGIRRRSFFGVLGIQNGDLIRTVNGRDMSDPSAALEAYSRLRGAERITVQLERRGQPRTHTYRIVD